MRVKAVEIVGHPGIGDVALSFSDAAGFSYPIVVLAGGNGTGKTAILEAIQKTFEGQLGAGIGHVRLDLEHEFADIAMLSMATNGQISTTLPPLNLSLSYDSNRRDSWEAFQLRGATASGSFSSNVVFPNSQWKGLFNSFLSEAALDFQTGALQSVTTLTLDDPDVTSLRSGQNLAQRIGQLLVDIRSADSEDLNAWVSQNPDIPPPNSVKNVRFGRFEKAFNAMFPHKRFKKVERRGGQLHIEFEEFGRVSSLNTLSTGEKQIVFRAGFLLQNLQTVSEGIVLIDEPELSLHPEWQSKIVGFYVALLKDANGRHPQLVFSTHSPFIVHGAVGAKSIILEKDPSTGKVAEMPAPHYPGLAGSEAVRAFNIEAFLQSAAQPMLILTEGETDAEILNTAWDKLRPGQPRFFQTKAALGDQNISITLNDQELYTKLGKRLIVGLFDFDGAYNRWNGVWKKSSSLVSVSESDGLVKRHATGLGWAMLLPVPGHRANYASQSLKGNSALSIEFLFEDRDIPDVMVASKPMPLGASIPYFRDDCKTTFANHVKSLPASAFAAFEVLLKRLEDIHKGHL